jgi:hypothetical protein
MKREKKIVKAYVVKSKAEPDYSDPNYVSQEELIALVSARSGVAPEKVKITLDLLNKELSKRLDEEGRVSLEGEFTELILEKLEVH